MRCKKAQRSLEAYLGGELAQRERARLARHLASCAECARELERAGHLRATLGEKRTPAVPEGFHAHLMERARRQAEHRGWPGKILDPFRRGPTISAGMRVAVAAGVLVAMGIGILIGADLWDAEKAPQARSASVAEAGDYGLDYLAGTPEGSVTGAYVRLASADRGE